MVSYTPRAGTVAFLLASLGCSGPDPRPATDLVRHGDLYLHPTTLEPYSGPVFTTFAGAPLEVEKRANLREGHYDGPFEWFFGNRRLSLREVYSEGLRDGPYEWYFESGRLYERGSYVDGHREGPYEAYYESGELFEKGTYRAGSFHGPRQWFRADRLVERVTYEHGRLEGPYERYDPNGALVLRGWLRDGQPCGVWQDGEAELTYPPCGHAS